MAQKIIKTYKKFGNYDVGLIQYNNNKKDTYLYVRGKYGGENPIIYEDGRVAYDNPENYPKRVKEYISKNSLKFKKEIYQEKLSNNKNNYNNPNLDKYKSKEQAIYDLNVNKGGDYDGVVDYVNNNWSK